MSNVTLSAGVRQNLLSLQNTADMMATTQNRLATGKKVNSALDNPTNYFTSQSLNTRANDLGSLLDSISNATKVLEAADNGIKAITDLVESAQSTVRQAQAANSSASGTKITGTETVDTTNATAGATLKETVENQTLSQLGFVAGSSNIEVISTSDSGVTKEFDLLQHFSNTGEALNDANGDTANGDNYTMKDLVDDINASGVATAEITAEGRLSIEAEGNKTLELRITDADGQTAGGATDPTISGGIGDMFGFKNAKDVLGTLADGSTGTVSNAGGTDVTYTDGAAVGDTDILSLTNTASASDANNAELVSQFNEILDQIDELARDASYNGINLINGTGNDLTVAFNEHRDSNKSELTIASADLSSSGLKLSDATSLSSSETDSLLDSLSDSLSTLRKQSSTFGSNLNTVTIREEFTKASINTLQTGADDLVLADTNEEGANMLALQTRQSLSTTALSLASQADKAVLSFLR